MRDRILILITTALTGCSVCFNEPTISATPRSWRPTTPTIEWHEYDWCQPIPRPEPITTPQGTQRP